MAFIIKDRIKETTTSTGTGAISLGGSSATFDTFSSVMSNGDTAHYAIVHETTGTDEWEVGLGTYNSSGNTLTRTTVLSSSNSNAAVNFSSGSKDIFLTVPATKINDFVDTPTITVTVANPGSGNKYYLDGALQQTALLGKSVTYRFDQSDSSNASHPIAFSTTSDGTHSAGSAITTGVVSVGTAGSAGAYTEITLEQDQVDTIYYYCQNHSGMGGKIYSGEDFSTLTSTITELNYVDGVTSNVQTQLDAKLPLAGGTMTGNIVMSGSETVDGRDLSVDGAKLDGIEASADVTDTTNVTAAGALMDSEVTNLAQVKAFDSSDYATAAQGTTADAALPKAGGQMTGNITMSGSETVDGRDLSVDGAKLDGIEANATADQTASEILTAIKTVDGSGSGLDADLLDGNEASAFLTAHPTISAASSVNNSGRTYIQDITLDSNGHVTGLTSATETVTDTNTTYSAGNGLSLSGTTFAMSGSFTGNFTATGNITAYSDERLKDNIETIEGSLDKVLKMRGVMYDRDGKRETGVIAQEIREILPEVVYDDGEYLSVAYGNLTGILIEAVKDLKQEIRELRDSCHNMVMQIEDLKSGSSK